MLEDSFISLYSFWGYRSFGRLPYKIFQSDPFNCAYFCILCLYRQKGEKMMSRLKPRKELSWLGTLDRFS